MAGWSDRPGGVQHAFITGPNGVGMTYLENLGAEYSSASGINDAGKAVGYFGTTVNNENPNRAFITRNGVEATDLGTLGGTYSNAYGINSTGQVVGQSSVAGVGQYGGGQHAFITGPNGMGMTDLGILDGYLVSLALGINEVGQVVGFSWGGPHERAFIPGPNGVGMTDLGTLGGDNSTALGINDIGQAVGSSETRDGSVHAFVTGPDGVGMTDLNSLLSLPSGVVLLDEEATAINNIGQVVVTQSTYTIPTVPAIPEPASYALMLAGLGLVGFMARRGKAGGAERWRSLV